MKFFKYFKRLSYLSIGTYGNGPRRKMAKAPVKVLTTRQILTDPLRSQRYPQTGLAILLAPSFNPKKIPT